MGRVYRAFFLVPHAETEEQAGNPLFVVREILSARGGGEQDDSLRSHHLAGRCGERLDESAGRCVPAGIASARVLVSLGMNLPSSKEMGIPDDLTCLLRNLYAGQEATVRTGHGITDWFQIGKGVHQGCILSPCLFNFYAEYIMRNAGLEEAQAGIKIARRNINNLRYADDTTLMAESEEELESLLMKVKVESEKVGLKLNIQKTKIMASGPITSWEIDGETVETVSDFILGGSKITADGDCSHEI